jgi:hypothetical protein
MDCSGTNKGLVDCDDNNSSFIYKNKDNHLVKMMLLRQDVINRKIGVQSWKKYVSSILWNYITTVINFTITLLTAICTGEAASSHILNQEQTVILLFSTFVLTTTNSFFKLNEKMNLNFKEAQTYNTFGAVFEKIYYKPVLNMNDVSDKLDAYEALHDEINNQVTSESLVNQNYFSEVIYLFLINNCLYRNFSKEKYYVWIRNNERHEDLDGVPKDKVKHMKQLIKDLLDTSSGVVSNGDIKIKKNKNGDINGVACCIM